MTGEQEQVLFEQLSKEDQEQLQDYFDDIQRSELEKDEAQLLIDSCKDCVQVLLDKYNAKNFKTPDGTWSRATSSSGGKVDMNKVKVLLALKGVQADLINQVIEEATSEKVTKDAKPRLYK